MILIDMMIFTSADSLELVKFEKVVFFLYLSSGGKLG